MFHCRFRITWMKITTGVWTYLSFSSHWTMLVITVYHALSLLSTQETQLVSNISNTPIQAQIVATFFELLYTAVFVGHRVVSSPCMKSLTPSQFIKSTRKTSDCDQCNYYFSPIVFSYIPMEIAQTWNSAFRSGDPEKPTLTTHGVNRTTHCGHKLLSPFEFHPSGVGKSSTSLLAGVKAGRVHLCRVAQVTLCDPIWQVTPRSSRTRFRRGLYSALTLTYK